MYHKVYHRIRKNTGYGYCFWQKIWRTSEKDLVEKHNYIADFEVYDQRASDANPAVVDIYIDIK